MRHYVVCHAILYRPMRHNFKIMFYTNYMENTTNNNKYRKFLIERLSYYRNNKGLSGRELSEGIDKNHSYISKFENGQFEMPSEKLLEAIEYCGCSFEEFFYSDYINYKIDKELLTQIKHLNFDERKTLLDFISKIKDNKKNN